MDQIQWLPIEQANRALREGVLRRAGPVFSRIREHSRNARQGARNLQARQPLIDGSWAFREICLLRRMRWQAARETRDDSLKRLVPPVSRPSHGHGTIGTTVGTL